MPPSPPEPHPELAAAVRRLDRTIDWERRDRSAGMRVDTAPVRALLDGLGNPERVGRWVHVAGSKGKGSLCAWLERGLLALGESTCVFASPHVESIAERARIDGRNADPAALARALERTLDVREAAAPQATWFDVLTAASFATFVDREAAWRIVEVGLGGRLDSTNVLAPSVCAITSIELEHTEVLGDTLAAIAREKAGILRAGVPAVVALDPAGEAGAAIAERARELEAPALFVPPAPSDGIHARNRRLATVVLSVLAEVDERLDPEIVSELDPPNLPGRLERRVHEGVSVVLDGAHTPESLGRVLAELGGDPELPGRPVVVFGAGRDKPLAPLLKLLAPTTDLLLCTSTDSGRFHPSSEVAQAARSLGLDAETASDPGSAVRRALARVPATWVLVTGSLHLVGEVRRHLPPPDARSCSPSSPTCS